MESENIIDNKNLIQKHLHIPQVLDISNSNSNNNYRIDNIYGSINNNISTSLSSNNKISYEPNNIYPMKINREYNTINTNSRRNRCRSSCRCGCHKNEEIRNSPDCNCIPKYNYEQCFTEMNSYLITKNEEMNKKNDELLNEIISLKRNLRRVEDELNRTKTEKDVSNFYIKELEKELFKLNMDNLSDSKNKIRNSIKMRELGRYHDMLNRSFEVLDSVSNKCNDPIGKTRGGINYYFNRNLDYNNVIDSQKKWIDNLPNSEENNTGSFFENVPSNINKNTKKTYSLHLYNFEPERNNDFSSHFNSLDNKEENSNWKITLSNDNNNIMNNISSNKMNGNLENSIPIKKRNNNIKQILHLNKLNNNKFNNINEKRINENNYEDEQKDELNNDFNEPQQEQYPNLNKRFLVTDSRGNPIFIEGKRLLAMEIHSIIGENGKEEKDKNGNILFLGPDGKSKSPDDLEPIILDNDKPLVNGQNKPLLGINGVIMVNKYGNPILGPGELYDKNNQVVHGELGLLPTDNKGNLVKINTTEEQFLNENNNENNNISNENNTNTNDINENNNNNSMIRADDSNSSNNNDEKDKNSVNEIGLKPLIGSDGMPVTDKKNNPIILDQNNKPVKNTGISLLLNPSGKPVVNEKGEPILINKEGKPINDSLMDNDNGKKKDKKNNGINYHKINPNKIRMRRKSDNIKRDSNKENRKINVNPIISEMKNGNKYAFPKPNPNYQRKINKNPVINIKTIDKKNSKDIFSNTCFACDVGCGVSRSGYSPMTYSPFDNSIRRREVTPLKDNIIYYQYYSKIE